MDPFQIIFDFQQSDFLQIYLTNQSFCSFCKGTKTGNNLVDNSNSNLQRWKLSQSQSNYYIYYSSSKNINDRSEHGGSEY